MNQVFELPNGASLFMTWQNGQTVVYDGFEYEHNEQALPLFSGHYEDARNFVEECWTKAIEEPF